jgi:hypothetical protein
VAGESLQWLVEECGFNVTGYQGEEAGQHHLMGEMEQEFSGDAWRVKRRSRGRGMAAHYRPVTADWPTEGRRKDVGWAGYWARS